MKSKLWIPVIVLAIGLSAYNRQTISSPSINNVSVKQAISLPSLDYCSIYAIGSLTKNGQEVGAGYDGYLFYFCSDLSFSVWTNAWVANGNWIMDEKSGMMVIDIAVPDDLAWLKGDWQVLEQNDYTLEMEHVFNGDLWRVRFERRQR